MNNNIETLKTIEKKIEADHHYTVFTALINCLSPEEVCELFDLGFNQSPSIRNRILGNINRDLNTSFLDCYTQLIYKQIELMAVLPRKKVVSCAYCLSTVYENCSGLIQNKIVNSFLSSPYKDIRSRAYKILRIEWSNEWVDKIAEVWNQYHDYSSIPLILEKMPGTFLNENFNDLFESIYSLSLISRLYLQLNQVSDERLAKLKQLDEITYCYVCAELGINPYSYSEGITAYEKYKLDSRIGLLIWSLGKMKLWDVILEIYEREKLRFENSYSN